jgi:threonine/homoserine/homoserine lactone efflux protein
MPGWRSSLGGLGLLLRAHPAAFDAIKMLGAFYLMWLGLRLPA